MEEHSAVRRSFLGALAGAITGTFSLKERAYAQPPGATDLQIAEGDPRGNPVTNGTEILRERLASPTGASLIGYTQTGNAAPLRTGLDKLREVVSVFDFYKGERWINDAFQRAVIALGNEGGEIFFPKECLVGATAADDGTYTGLLAPFTSQHDTGKRLNFRFTRGARLLADYDDMIVFRLSDSYTVVDNLMIDGNGKRNVVGLGIIPENINQSNKLVHQSHNVIRGLFVKDCQEALIMRSGPKVTGVDSSCWYNRIYDLHAYRCGRGIWMREATNPGGSTVNRNFFFGIRIGNRCNTGVQIDAGGTNTFFGLSFEGIQNSNSPNHVPTALKIADVSAYGQANNDNQFFGTMFESNVQDIENDNPMTQLHGHNAIYSKCVFNKLPRFMSSASAAASPQIAMGGHDEFALNATIPGLPTAVRRMTARGLVLKELDDVSNTYDELADGASLHWQVNELTLNNAENVRQIAAQASKFQRFGGWVEWNARLTFRAFDASRNIGIKAPRNPEMFLYEGSNEHKSFRLPVMVLDGSGNWSVEQSYFDKGRLIVPPPASGKWNMTASTNEIHFQIRYKEEGTSAAHPWPS